MAVAPILRSVLRMRWRLKAVLPVVGVLLLGLIVFEIVVIALGIPRGHWILLVAAAGAVVIFGVLLAALIVLIERPLRELVETIERIEAGDFSAEVSFAKRDDDVGELGKNFNAMVRRLRQNRAEIERLHQREMSRAEHLATLGELAAGLAHEIRNPLAGIAGVVDVLGKELPRDSPNHAILSEVQNEIRQIQNLLGDLLAYARPRPPQFLAADLNATVEQAVVLGRQQVRTRPIEIRFAPAAGLESVVHDPAQIQQVALNLILNAIQAIPQEGRVAVALRRDGEYAVLTVEDTGRGISPEALPKIFRPFYTTRTEGTGLGLPLAKGIVESHGGQIQVSSTLGHGSRFEVRLPATLRLGGKARAASGVIE